MESITVIIVILVLHTSPSSLSISCPHHGICCEKLGIPCLDLIPFLTPSLELYLAYKLSLILHETFLKLEVCLKLASLKLLLVI
jgi:hypothetical protein